MKKLFILGAAIVLFNFKAAETLTEQERKFATDQLSQSKEHFLKIIKDLTSEQLNFKPTPDVWSVAECAEHIAISENMIFSRVEEALKATPDAARRSEVKMTDDQVVQMITDRSYKVKTNEAFQPKNTFGSIEGTIKEFTSKRDQHIEFIDKTTDDLRNRIVVFPFTTLDSYQVIIFMAAHSERHTRQMEEVMAHPDFPKKK